MCFVERSVDNWKFFRKQSPPVRSFRLTSFRHTFSDRPRREPPGPHPIRFLHALFSIPARFATGHTVHGGGDFNGSDLVLFFMQSWHSAGEWRNFPVATAGVWCRAGVTIKVKTRPAPILIGFERRSVVVHSVENNVPRFATTPSPLPLTRNRVIISDKIIFKKKKNWMLI